MSAGQLARDGVTGELRHTVAAVVRRLALSRWGWVLALIVLVAARHLLGPDAYPLAPTFGDTDDALRQLQVREFLAR
jgi:hypothetical protein